MKKFLVLGAGFQGRACAFDLLRSPGVAAVALADADAANLASAKKFLAKVAHGRAKFMRTDVADASAVSQLMRGRDAVVSCVPYFLNLPLARVAINAKVHFVDLGGSTEIVKKELALSAAAKKAGVCVLPDNGLGPGMISTLAVHAMSLLDRTDAVMIYDGGLPQKPLPPLNYMLTFSEHGLINEYAGTAVALKNSKLVRLPALSEIDRFELAPLGPVEAGHAAGGLSTLAESYQGRVKTMFNKFIRYPGHIPAMEAMRAIGYFDEAPIKLNGAAVSPRALSAKLFRRHFHRPGDEDLVIIHSVVRGVKDGRRAEVVHDLLDYYDRENGMTAMMRTTAFPASIVAQMAASGIIQPGAWTVEAGVPPEPFIKEAKKRGFKLRWKTKLLN